MTAFTGVGPLVRFVLRRDRVFLPVWIGAIVATVYASVVAVAGLYDTPAERVAYAATMGESPASVAMAGPPVALTTTGGILVYETSLTALLGVALMAVFTVVRHTRREEEAGRTELLGSTVISPHAMITAAVLVSSAASLLVGLGVTLSFLAEAQPLTESLLYGASIGAFGIVFTGVAACAAQVMTHGRGAVGVSLAVLAVAFGLRAVGDIGAEAWSWMSPMGWSQQVRVYEENQWWPLLLSLLLTLALLAATVALEARRDLGAGLVQPRPGPAGAGRSLSGVLGLSWRLQRGALAGWLVGVFAMGLLLGSFSESIQDMIEANPTLADYFAQSTGGTLVDAFFATSLLLLAIGGSGFAVSSALRTRSEETADRVEPLLATAASRSRWLFANLAVTLTGAVLVLAVGGLGTGITYAITSGRPEEVARMTALSLVYLPAVLLLAALVVLLVGWVPRASAAAWAVLALAFVVGWLGGLLKPPQWVENLSPFTHVPAVPLSPVAATPLLVLTLLAALAVLAGWRGLLARDIG